MKVTFELPTKDLKMVISRHFKNPSDHMSDLCPGTGDTFLTFRSHPTRVRPWSPKNKNTGNLITVTKEDIRTYLSNHTGLPKSHIKDISFSGGTLSFSSEIEDYRYGTVKFTPDPQVVFKELQIIHGEEIATGVLGFLRDMVKEFVEIPMGDSSGATGFVTGDGTQEILWMVHDTENGILYCRRAGLWEVLESTYGLLYMEISDNIQAVMKEHFKRDFGTPGHLGFPSTPLS